METTEQAQPETDPTSVPIPEVPADPDPETPDGDDGDDS
jgi:hypothetical protein